MNAELLIKENQGSIVDVRSIEEFSGGHCAGSVNIPLHEIPQRITELKGMAQPLILCCASGGRSGQATAFLSQQGLSCINAGSWMDVNYFQTLKN